MPRCKHAFAYVLLLASTILYPMSVAADPVAPGEVWTLHNSGTTPSLNSVTWTGSRFVAVGANGAIRTSPDGVVWTPRTSGTNRDLRSVTWSGTQLVAVGVNGITLTSPNGITWTAQASGTTATLNAVTWTGRRFVAVGANNANRTSPDGVTWTQQTSETTTTLNAVTSNTWRVVAVGTIGAVSGAVSSAPVEDSTLFFLIDAPAGVNSALNAVTWTGSQFVAVGASGVILTSSLDGGTWTRQTSGTTANLRAISWTGTHLVAVGASGVILTSSDGVTWTQRTSGTTATLNAITWTGSRFVVMGTNGTVLTSGEGLAQPPPDFTYPSPQPYQVGTPVTLAPFDTGGTATWSVTPPLPAGLTFNTATGVITGTPIAASAATSHTVIATNATGSATAVFDIAVLPSTVPGAPRIDTITSAIQSRTIQWTAPESNGGAVITSYTVTAWPDGSTCTWTSGPLTCTITGLRTNGQYSFTVTATNFMGTGPASQPLPAFFTFLSPQQPYHVGTPVTLVPFYTRGAAAWSVTPALPAGLSLNTATGTITGTPVAASAAAGYTVVATNATGSDTAVLDITVLPSTVPGAPTGVTAIPADQFAIVSWTAPTDDGGTAITGYTVTAHPGGATCAVGANPLTCTITGLTNGTAYTFTVTATNWVGTGTASAPSAPVMHAVQPSLVWTARTSGTPYTLYAVTWAGTRFVAVGGAGLIYTSPDGVTWTQRTSGTSNTLNAVAWNGTQLVAVGENGTIRTSPNGTSWAAQTFGTGTEHFYSVIWTGAQFVAVGTGRTIRISTDGINWTPQSSGHEGGVIHALTAVTWTGAQFVAVGTGGTIRTSADGINWITQTSGTTSQLMGVAWTGTRLVVVGDDGIILTSADGITWIEQISGTTADLSGVAWTGTQFVVVGAGGTIRTSPDGIAWTGQTSGTNHYLCSVAWTGTRLLVVGAGGTVLTSGDQAPLPPAFTYASPQTLRIDAPVTLDPNDSGGVAAWSVTPPLPAGLSLNTATGTITGTPSVAGPAMNHTIIATNAQGSDTAVVNITVLALSIPGPPSTVTATSAHQSATVWWNAPENDGGTVITGYTVTASPGGSTCVWTAGPRSCTITGLTNGTPYAFTVTAANSVGTGPASQPSAEVTPTAQPGLVWTAQSGLSSDFRSIAWTGKRFVAVGLKGAIATSSDGVTWTIQASGTTQDIRSVVWTGTQLVTVGDGSVRRSPDGITWISSASAVARSVTWTGTQLVRVGGSTLSTVSTSPDGITWTSQNSVTDNLLDIAWTGTQLVVVGPPGSIRTSPNGIDWTTQASGTTDSLFAVTWTGTQLVAVGQNGTIRTSTDGITWTAQTSGTSSSLRDVAWTGNQLVAVGDKGAIRTSPDGKTWTAGSVPGAPNMNAVATGGGRLVAMGASGAILTSGEFTPPRPAFFSYSSPQTYKMGEPVALSPVNSSGGTATWSVTPPLPAGLSLNTATGEITGTPDAASAATFYVITASNATYTDTSIVIITVLSSTVPGAPTSVTAFRNDQSAIVSWVAPQSDGGVTITGYTVTASPGGGTCTWTTGPLTCTITGLTNGIPHTFTVTAANFIGMGPTSQPSAPVTPGIPAPAELWITQASGTTNNLSAVAWTGTQFVAVGQNGTILTSPEGVTWTTRTSGTSNTLNAVAWTGTQLVAVGLSGTILTSPDGVTWAAQNSGTTIANLVDIIWTGTQLVVIRGGISILTSLDGIVWTEKNFGSGYLTDIAWTGTQFVAVGLNGGNAAIFTSPDGVTWTPQTSGTSNTLNAVTWTGTQLVAVGNSGTILTSPDGINWTTRTSGITDHLYSVMWTGTQFVAGGLGRNGAIITSPDGINWTTQTSATVVGSLTRSLFDVTVGGGRLIAVGTSGLILTSGDFTPTPPPIIAYASPQAYTVGAAIATLNVSSTGGPVTGYAMQGTALPAGLALDPATGTITGTPTAATATAEHRIVAYGPGGFDTAVVNITVAPTHPGVPTITTATSGNSQVQVAWTAPITNGGTPITGYTVTASPGDSTCTSSTDLLECTITGLSNGVSYCFSVVALNSVGNSLASPTICDVVPNAPPIISYVSPPTYLTGTAITPLTVSSTGGPVTSYSVLSTALPTGLALAAATGEITGTPDMVSATADYLILATGPGGLDTATITITVHPAPPTGLSYAPDSASFVRDSVLTAWAPTVTGTVTTWSISPALPTGLAFHPETGVITGIPTAASPLTAYTVTASNITGSTTKVIHIEVMEPVSIQPGSFVFRVTGAEKPYAFMLPAGTVGVDKVTLRIVDMWGRTMWRTSVKPDGKAKEITWNGITTTGSRASAGMYVVRIAVTGQGKTTEYVRKTVTLKPR